MGSSKRYERPPRFARSKLERRVAALESELADLKKWRSWRSSVLDALPTEAVSLVSLPIDDAQVGVYYSRVRSSIRKELLRAGTLRGDRVPSSTPLLVVAMFLEIRAR